MFKRFLLPWVCCSLSFHCCLMPKYLANPLRQPRNKRAPPSLLFRGKVCFSHSREGRREGGAFHSFFLHLSKGLFLLNISSLAALLFSPPPSSALQTESGGGVKSKPWPFRKWRLSLSSSPLRRPWYGIQQLFKGIFVGTWMFLKNNLSSQENTTFYCMSFFCRANFLLFILLAEK